MGRVILSALCNEMCIYFNGKFIKERRDVIDFDDRGFRYGDGVFETIRVNNGELFRFNNHLSRIKRGLAAIKINFDAAKLERASRDLLKKNNVENGFLRIAISRGVGSEGYMPKCEEPTILVQTIERGKQNNKPIDLWLSSYRKIPDICIPSDIKSAQGMNSTLARMQAQENGCFEALQLSVDGKICEGSSGNIFWFKRGKLYTPANNILKGVMREAIIEKSPYEVVEGDFELECIKSAEEVFITNVAWAAKPVKSLKPEGLAWGQTRISKELVESIF